MNIKIRRRIVKFNSLTRNLKLNIKKNGHLRNPKLFLWLDLLPYPMYASTKLYPYFPLLTPRDEELE